MTDLSHLDVGDMVALYSQGNGFYAILKIEKKTPTGIMTLSNGRKFRPNGGEIGIENKWSSVFISPVTPEIRAEIARKRNIGKLSKINWSDVSDDKIIKILSILDEK
jgi:hypothetical protein